MSSPARARQKLFNTRTAASLTRLTDRQFQWATENRFLNPTIEEGLDRGSGGRCYFYSLDDLVQMSVMNKLHIAGARMRAAVKKIRQFSGRFLVVGVKKSGTNINYFALEWSDSPKDVISLGAKAACGIQLIDVQEIREQIEKKAGLL